MSFIETLLTVAATGIVTAWATAFAQHKSTKRIDSERALRRRHAVGVMIQAELVRLHMDLKQHNRRMEGYALKAAKGGATEESDFPKFETNASFPVFHGLMADIGLFGHELSYRIAYCYFNCERFLVDQQVFVHDLPTRLRSSELATSAKDLSARETALMAQIACIIPMVARQSQAIPFDPAVG
jgi:hypothetical protein